MESLLFIIVILVVYWANRTPSTDWVTDMGNAPEFEHTYDDDCLFTLEDPELAE